MADGAKIEMKRGTFDRLLGIRANLGTVKVMIKIHPWPM